MDKKNVIFIGCKDKELTKVCIMALQSTKCSDESVFVELDKGEVEELSHKQLKKVISYKEKEEMSEFLKNIENIKLAFNRAKSFFKLMKEYAHIQEFSDRMEIEKAKLAKESNYKIPLPEEVMEGYNWHGWCTLKDVVMATNYDYKKARQVLEFLFLFGLCSIEEKGGKEYFRIFGSDEEVVIYLDVLKRERETEFNDFNESLDHLRSSVEKRIEKMKSIPESEPETTSEVDTEEKSVMKIVK